MAIAATQLARLSILHLELPGTAPPVPGIGTMLLWKIRRLTAFTFDCAAIGTSLLPSKQRSSPSWNPILRRRPRKRAQRELLIN